MTSSKQQDLDFLKPNHALEKSKPSQPKTLPLLKSPKKTGAPQSTLKGSMKSTYKAPEKENTDSKKQAENTIKPATETKIQKTSPLPKEPLTNPTAKTNPTASTLGKTQNPAQKTISPPPSKPIPPKPTPPKPTPPKPTPSNYTSFTKNETNLIPAKERISTDKVKDSAHDGLKAWSSKNPSPPTTAVQNQTAKRFDSPTARSTSNTSIPKPTAAPPKTSTSSTTPPPNLKFTSSSTTKEKAVPVNELTDKEFNLLREFLYQQSGIFVTDSRKYLFENRLTPRLNEFGMSSFSEYHDYLKFKDSSKVELNKFYEKMTTNETSFFRNVPQLDTVRDEIFKKIIEENKSTRKIRIWSAGCSSGEEPYTLAIMLSELLKEQISGWNIKITANDLSPAMLKIAQEAAYGEYALRTTPKEYIDKYFTQKDSLFHIKPSLKKLIQFGQINLNDKAQTSKVEKSQVIFCRNVIIYFDDDVRENVISAFHNNLLDDGKLIIGHSETLQNISTRFNITYHKGTSIYHKI